MSHLTHLIYSREGSTPVSWRTPKVEHDTNDHWSGVAAMNYYVSASSLSQVFSHMNTNRNDLGMRRRVQAEWLAWVVRQWACHSHSDSRGLARTLVWSVNLGQAGCWYELASFFFPFSFLSTLEQKKKRRRESEKQLYNWPDLTISESGNTADKALCPGA